MKRITHRLSHNKMKQHLIQAKILKMFHQIKRAKTDADLTSVDGVEVNWPHSAVEMFDKVAWRNGNQ